MNNRQKMKRMKRKLEFYKKQQPTVSICQMVRHKIHKLAADRMFTKEDEEILGEDGIARVLAADILDEIANVIDISKYNAGFGMSDRKHYRAELCVVLPEKKDMGDEKP